MPPNEGIAIGTIMSAPRPVEVSTGSSARIVVTLVIIAGALGGALAGAAMGSKAEQSIRTVAGYELDDGRIVVIVQEADAVFLVD